MRGLRWPLLFVFLCALGAGVIVMSLGREVTGIGIRTRTAHDTPAGWVLRDSPPGQLMRPDFDGLDRVEFRVVRQGPSPGQGLVLEVRDVGDGELEGAPVVRTATWTPSDGTPLATWASFRFDPIAGSRGRTYHLVLRPEEGATHSVWAPIVRARGSLGVSHPWGPRVTGDPIQVDFRAPPEGPGLMYSGGLWAIAVAFSRLRPETGEPAIELLRLPRDGEEGAPELVARGTLGHDAPINAGYGLFLLDRPCDLRLAPLRAVIRVPGGTAVAGRDNTPGLALYHGLGDPTPGLLGQTLAGERLPHRDLCFQAFGDGGVAANWALLGERGARWRYVLGLLLWAAAMTAAVAFWRQTAARHDQTNSSGA